jgi:hypothetical protein
MEYVRLSEHERAYHGGRGPPLPPPCDGQIALDEAQAALLSECDGRVRLADGIHGRTEQRNFQLDAGGLNYKWRSTACRDFCPVCLRTTMRP